MKKLVPIILILMGFSSHAWSPNVWQDGLVWEKVKLDSVYHTGDSVQISFTVVKNEKFFYDDSVKFYSTNYTILAFDTIYFSKCEVVLEQPQVIQYRTKIAIPYVGDANWFRPRLGGYATPMQSLKVTKYPTAVLDETIDKRKEVAYYMDMTGKVVQELKGIGIVVYKDGTREKVIFE